MHSPQANITPSFKLEPNGKIIKARMAGSKNKINLAVLYFCYNREDHLRQSLPKIVEFKNELPLFVFCDGPRKEDKKQTKINEDLDRMKKIISHNFKTQ